MPAVKIGVSRQIAIPKRLHDELGLAPGDYLEVERRGNQLILTPKALIEKRLAEALDDVEHGRVGGPYASVDELISSLHGARRSKRTKTGKRSA